MSDGRVVVTGRGLISPLGIGLGAHWEALLAGQSAIADVPHLVELSLPASRGGEVDASLLASLQGRLPRKQQKLYNRTTLLAMLASSLAMDDAGLSPGAGDPARFGVLLGARALWWDLLPMMQYLETCESAARPGTLDMAAANTFCMKNINPLDFSLKTLPNLVAGHVAIAQDAQGMCRVLVDGAVGTAHAMGQAYQMVSAGDLDVALCGGSDAQLDALNFTSAWGLGLLASDTGDRPGIVMGEGAAFLVIEREARARARSAVIHAEIQGFAVTAGVGRFTSSDDIDRLATRLTGLIEDATVQAGGVPDVICVHGDGIPAHDEAEAKAISAALGTRAGSTPVLRPKLAHSDLGAAAPVVDVLTCSALLSDGRLPKAITSGAEGFIDRPRRVLVLALGYFDEAAALMVGCP